MLTHRTKECLAFIERYQALHGGVSPSVREIMDGVDLRSVSSVVRQLDALEMRGYIQRMPARKRCIAVLKSAPNAGERSVAFRFDDASKRLVPYEPDAGQSATIVAKTSM